MNGSVNYLKFLISGDGSQLDAELKKSKRTVTGYVDDISASVGKLSTAFGGLLAGISVAGFVGKLVSVQREFDVLNSSLTTVTGSSAAAAREMAWLKDFAKETPYGLAQATEGFVKMKALGLNPTRESLTSFGNTASAMGKDLMQMIEAVADASTGEFERLKEFGVKSSKEGENVKFTFQGVTTTVRNSSEEITSYLESIGNNQFASAMSERAKTLDGAIAALGDSWDELFRTVNQNNTGGFIYDSVTLANGALEDLNTILQASNAVVTEGASSGNAYKSVQDGLAVAFETVAVLGTNVKYVLTGVGTELGGLAAQAAAVLRGDFAGAAEIRRQMVDDAKNARVTVDAQTEAILNARKRAADAIASKPAAGSDLAALANSVNGYKPQTVTDASLKGMADSLLKSSAGFKSTAESMAEVRKKGDEIGAMISRLKAQGLSDSPEVKQLEDRLVGVKEKLKSMAEKADEGAKSTKQLQTAYGNFLNSLDEKIALETVDLESGKKATESDKLRIKFQQDLQGSLKGLTAAQKANVTAKLDELEALEKQNQQRKEFLQLAELERTRRLEAFRAAEQTVGGLLEGNKQLREEIELIGLSALQQQAITMARQQAVIAVKEQHLAEMERASASSGFMSREQIALQQEIELLKERLALTSLKSAREASATAAAASVSEWQRGVEQIGQSLSDQLMAGGRGFGEYLKNLARTLVFKPIIQAIVQPVGGYVANMMGVPNGGGAVGSGLGAINDLSSLYSAFSGGLVSTVGGAIGSLGATFGSSALTSIAAGMKGSTLAAGLAGPTTAGATGAMGLGATVGAALPWVAGGLALYSLISSMDDSGTPHMGAASTYSGGALSRGWVPDGTWSAGVQTTTDAVALSLGSALDAAAKTFGQKAGYTLSATFSDDSSKDGAFGALKITDALGKVVADWASYDPSWGGRWFDDGEAGVKQWLTATAGEVKGAILQMDLPGWARQILGAASDLDSINAALQQIGTIKAVFDSLGQTIDVFAGITSDLQTRLLNAAGGIDALANAAGAFYQGFYSEQERMDSLTDQLRQSLSALGSSIDPSIGEHAKVEFRDAVRGAMESGQVELAYQLMAMSSSFATAAEYAQKAATTAAEAAADALQKARDTAIDNAWTNVQAALDREKSYWSGIASASQAAIGSLTGTLDLLTSNARELYGTVDSAQQMLAAQGMVYIEDALTAVRGGASASGFDKLQESISAARGGISGGVYATQFDRERDALVLAGKLSELGELTDSQLTVEERQLKAAQTQIDQLDQALGYWQRQIDGTGQLIDVGLSTVDAISALAAALAAREQAKLQPQKGPTAGGALDGMGPYQYGGGNSFLDGVIDYGNKYGSDAYYFIPGVNDYAAKQQSINDISAITGQSASDLWGSMFGGLGADYWQAVQNASNAGAVVNASDSLDDILRKAGVPGYAVGANYIPNDQLAFLHKGEAVVPAPFNPWAGGMQRMLSGNGMSGNTERLEQLVEKVAVELQRLQTIVGEGNRAQSDLLDITDQKSEGGSADRVRITNVQELAVAIKEVMA